MNIEQLINEVEKHEDQADRIFAAAMWYAANDIPVLPADVNGRLPGKKFGNWNYGTSTTRPEKIVELFGVGGKFRGWNISLPCGPISGISVVDIDNKNGKDGTEAWSELEAAYGAVPEDVLVARTPSGGIHMFFEHRPGFYSSNPATTSSNGLLPGVDTRGGSKADKTKSGGHVLLYPSRKAGGQYTFDAPHLQDSSLPTPRIVPPPDWIIDLLAGVKPVVAEPSLSLPEVIPAGGRDTTLYNYALRLIARGYSDDDVEYHLTQAGNRLHPPDPAMVDKVIRSALSSQVHEKATLTQELSTKIRRNEKSGAILPTVENFYQIVQSSLFKSYVDLCYDEFRMRVVPTNDHRAPTNMDDAYNVTERVLSREFALDKMRTIISNHLVSAIRESNCVDSLRMYFDILPAPSGSTIDHLSYNILGLEPNSLQDAYLRCWLRAGVYRAYYPGAKFDNILVLIGQQGIRKSTFFRALTPGEARNHTDGSNVRHSWFTDSVGKDRDLSHPDEIRKLNGKFIGELAEMHGMSRSDIRAVKHFLSEQEGEYVQKYKEDVAYVPRRFILGGTSNESDYMGDDTGNRRFWNINLNSKSIDTDWVYANANNIWAEAKYEVMTLKLPCVLSKEMELLQIIDNKNFEQSDAWEEVVLDWASTRSRFTRAQVLVEVLGFELNQIKQQDQMRIGKIFKRAGWTTKQVKSGHQKARALINPDPEVEKLFKGKLYDTISEV